MPIPRPYAIAIVDDEPSVLEALGNLLEAVGYSVLRFESGEAFLGSDSVSSIDCLISDIGMPGMNGVALQAELGRMRPDIPVLLITGRAFFATVGLDAPNNRGSFRKPFDIQQLLDALVRALGDDRRA